MYGESIFLGLRPHHDMWLFFMPTHLLTMIRCLMAQQQEGRSPPTEQ